MTPPTSQANRQVPEQQRVLPLSVAVVVTLVVYWVAGEYAALLGDHFEGERTPTWPH